MLNKEYLLNEYGLNGEDLPIEDKMNTLDKSELKDFISYCASNKVFPSNTSLKSWILQVDRNDRIRSTAKWLCENNLFGDVYDLLKIVDAAIDRHTSCDIEDYERHCIHDTEMNQLHSWFNEYLSKD